MVLGIGERLGPVGGATTGGGGGGTGTVTSVSNSDGTIVVTGTPSVAPVVSRAAITGDVTIATGSNAAVLVGTTNVESIIRSQASQIFNIGPSSSTNFNNQSITQLSQLSMTDGTAADGQILASLAAPLIKMMASSADTQPTVELGTVSSNPTLAFGVGGTTAPDVSLSRTATNILTLKANSLLLPSATGVASAVDVSNLNGQTVTGSPPTVAYAAFNGTYTVNFANATIGSVLGSSPTVTFLQSGLNFAGLGPFSMAFVTPTFVTGTTVGTTFTFGPTYGMNFQPTFKVDTQVGITGLSANISFKSSPTYAVNSTGTATSATAVGYLSAGSVASGQTVTAWTDYQITAIAGTGSVTQQIGLDIPVLIRSGITTVIGIRNASPTVLVPSTAQVVAAAFTVTANATHVQLTSTGAVSGTTAAPTIAVPVTAANGQKLHIVNANTTTANTMTFTSGATEKLSLGAATRVVGAGGSLTLIYNSTFGRWVEVGFNGGGN